MRRTSAKRKSPDAGPISAAVTASAEGLRGDRLELECALADASSFGRLAYLAFCHLGLDKAGPLTLDQEESDLLYWTMVNLRWMIDEAQKTFHGEHDAKGASS